MYRIITTASLALLATPSLGDVIGFDSFADGLNINGMDLGGVTVENPSGVVEIFANNRFGVGTHVGPNVIASFVNGNESSNPMVFVFDEAQTFVSLWGGDSGNDTDSWRLDAYDETNGGNLVDSMASGDWNGDPFRQLSVSGPGILRVEAVWTGTEAGVAFDTLEFIPAPSAATLLGLSALAATRRRRR